MQDFTHFGRTFVVEFFLQSSRLQKKIDAESSSEVRKMLGELHFYLLTPYM